MPMTPQAGLPPAFPVFLLSACPPFPRSSVPAWTTMVLPRTECSPMSLMCESDTDPFAFPWPSVLKFPRSPTCRSESSGAPCSFPNGLTWPVSVELRLKVRLTMRTSRCATVCVVTELMDMHSSLCICIVTSDIPWDACWRRFRWLLEGNGSFDVRVSSKDSDCQIVRDELDWSWWMTALESVFRRHWPALTILTVVCDVWDIRQELNEMDSVRVKYCWPKFNTSIVQSLIPSQSICLWTVHDPNEGQPLRQYGDQPNHRAPKDSLLFQRWVSENNIGSSQHKIACLFQTQVRM